MYLDCCSNYHNNFVVQNGQRLYYSGIPEYIQVGEHQFVEQRIVKMWVNMMLVAWYVLAITYYYKLFKSDYIAPGFPHPTWQNCMKCHSLMITFKTMSGSSCGAWPLNTSGMHLLSTH